MLVINDLMNDDYKITVDTNGRKMSFVSNDNEHECQYSLTPEQWERFTRNLTQLNQSK